MRIAIIGPGVMPIPPNGWGAIEILIWEYYIHLNQYGIDAHIINTSSAEEIIKNVNDINPDIVHIHYEDWYFLWNKFNCKKVIITNHNAYMECPHRRNLNIINGIVNSEMIIHCLSQGIYDLYISLGVTPDRLFILSNGANKESFYFLEKPETDKAIYLAKIDFRKRQYVYQNIPEIDFVGNLSDNRFDANRANYLGEWNKDTLYKNLSTYATLVLLSDGEAHPLVCCEALVCGLGLVVSSFASANLDKNRPFITIIPDNKLDDIDFIQEQVKRNIEISKCMRQEIREYGMMNFSWSNIIKQYINILQLKIIL